MPYPGYGRSLRAGSDPVGPCLLIVEGCMSQRTLGRIFVLVTLTLVLAVAAPLWAEATPQRIGPASLWGWLDNLWQESIGRLVRWEPTAPARSGTNPGFPQKNCTALDPNGCPSSPNGSGSGASGAGAGG